MSDIPKKYLVVINGDDTRVFYYAFMNDVYTCIAVEDERGNTTEVFERYNDAWVQIL